MVVIGFQGGWGFLRKIVPYAATLGSIHDLRTMPTYVAICVLHVQQLGCVSDLVQCEPQRLEP